ncbi:MAG: hypothetical protein U0U67_07355 [Chitinophagales bacterium]
MYNSKLLDVFRKFDETKINNFSQYINIYKSKRENATIKLFELISNEFPNFDSKKLEKKKAHKYLFPTKTYDEKRMLNSMSDLLKITEEFIAYSYAKNNQLENQFYLLQFYLENDLTKFFESTYKNTKEIISKEPENMEILAFSYKLAWLNLHYQLKYNTRYANYQEAQNTLNDFVISQQYKLDTLCFTNLYNDVTKEKELSSLATFYQSLHQLIIEQKEAYYFQNKEAIFQKFSGISKNELKLIVTIIIDYCIRKINQKEAYFNNELLVWYDFLEEQNIILEANNTISAAIVKNYISVATHDKQFERAINFIERFHSFLDETEKEDVYNYNKATILFHQNKLEDALVLLNTAKYKDIFYKIDSKRLYIKLYFELSKINEKRYFDVMDSTINAFKKYVYTTKEITEPFRERNKNFYKYINKLINLPANEKAKLTTLKEEINKDNACSDKDWLLNKISEMTK